MKRLLTYLFYFTGWLCLTIMYIFSTQLDDQQQSGFAWLKLHKSNKVVLEENTDDEKPTAYELMAHAHVKHHKHFAPFSKHKAKPKESHPRTVSIYVTTDCTDAVRPVHYAVDKTAYSDYLKYVYHYLFFQEINPPPPKAC